MATWSGTLPTWLVAPVPAADLQIMTDALHGLTDAWTVWTPTLTNLTLGNGTVVARHRTAGKTMHFRFRFTLGSTSAVGSSPRFTLPFAAHADYGLGVDKAGWSSAGNQPATANYDLGLRFITNTQSVEFVILGTNGIHVQVTATAPFTFATNDSLSAFGVLELA